MSDNNILMAQTMIHDLRAEGDSLRELIRELQTQREDLEGQLRELESKWRRADNAVRFTIEAVVDRAKMAEARLQVMTDEGERLDDLLLWITALAWAGSTNPRMIYDPIYVDKRALQQILAAGGYTPDRLC